MPHEELVTATPPFARQEEAQPLLHAIRVALAREPEPPRHAAHVRVDREGLVGAEVDEHHARRLPAHPGQRLQRGAFARHAPTVERHDRAHGAHHALRLGAEKAERLDERPERLRLRARIGGGIGEAGEQCRRDEVHPRVGALRGQDDRDEELQVVLELERDARLRHGPLQPVHHLARPRPLALGRPPRRSPGHLALHASIRAPCGSSIVAGAA